MEARVYEAGGKTSEGVKITFAATPVEDYDANLIEEAGRNLRAYEIKTFKLQFGKSK